VNAPKITASFILDGLRPQTVERKYVHYRITLNVVDCPPSTFAVTYELHPSFPNSIREVRATEGEEGFPLRIATYGDFEVRAEIRTLERTYRISRFLSKALRESYDRSTSTEIQNAMQQIASH